MLEQKKGDKSESVFEEVLKKIVQDVRMLDNRVESPFTETPSHTTVRAMSHTAVSDLCLPNAS